MRNEDALLPLMCGAVSAAFLAALIWISPASVMAAERPKESQSCTCPSPEQHDPTARPPRPKFAGNHLPIDSKSEVAALEAVHIALSEVGDGSSYIWHHPSGLISGMIQPTGSFKDQSGRICRHIVLVLTADERSRKTEGIACRLPNGIWQLDG